MLFLPHLNSERGRGGRKRSRSRRRSRRRRRRREGDLKGKEGGVGRKGKRKV